MKSLTRVLFFFILLNNASAQTINQASYGFEVWGTINSMVIDQDKLYLGGSFDRVGKNYVNCAKILNDSLKIDYHFPVINGKVNGLFSDGKGGAYYWGEFTKVGDSTRNGFAHIDSLNNISSLNLDFGTPDFIRSIINLPGEIIVAGDFTSINGMPVNYLASINTVTGAINPSAVPVVNDYVYDLQVKDNDLYMSGVFDTVGGIYHRYICKVDLTTRNTSGIYIESLDSLQFVQPTGIERIRVLDSTLFIVGCFDLPFWRMEYDALSMTYVPVNYHTNGGCVEYAFDGDTASFFSRSDKNIYPSNYYALNAGIYIKGDTLISTGWNTSYWMVKLEADTIIELSISTSVGSYGPNEILPDPNNANNLFYIGNPSMYGGYADFDIAEYFDFMYLNPIWEDHWFQYFSTVNDAQNVKNGRILAGELNYFGMLERTNLAKIDLTTVDIDQMDIRPGTSDGSQTVQKIVKMNHTKTFIGDFYVMNGSIPVSGVGILDATDQLFIPEPIFNSYTITPELVAMNASHTYIYADYDSINGAPSSNVIGIRLNDGSISDFNSYPCTINAQFTLATWEDRIIHFQHNGTNPIMVITDTNATIADSLSCSSFTTIDSDYGAFCPDCITEEAIVGGDFSYSILTDLLDGNSYLVKTDLNTLNNVVLDTTYVGIYGEIFDHLEFIDSTIVVVDRYNNIIRFFDTLTNNYTPQVINVPFNIGTYTTNGDIVFVASTSGGFTRDVDPSSKIAIYQKEDFYDGPDVITGVASAGKQSFSLYPNPNSSNTLQINGPEVAIIESISIFDLQGQLYKTCSIDKRQQNQLMIGLQEMKSGIYLVKINGDGFVETHKLVIQH